MRMNAPVLLVGSIPGDDAEDVLRRTAAGVGDLCACLPDGETGLRKAWINFLAAGAYDHNPALESVNRPLPHDPAAADEWRDPNDHWIPRGYTDHWQFRVRPGRQPTFAELGYAAAARASYAVFKRLRDTGEIASGTRFMVCLPLVESATRPFLASGDDFAAMHAAYSAAVAAEIERLLEAIPAQDLVIQWDLAIETVAIECDDTLPGLFPWRPAAAAFDRYRADVTAASAMVPEAVVMGLHLCYGDLGHRHIIEPASLAVCVRMANAAAAESPRAIDFYHMPVPRDRSDADYVEPLADLAIGDARLYLGLVHLTDGVAGSRQRMAMARRYVNNFGIATECGFGRRPIETVDELFEIHRALAAELDD